MSPSSPSRNPVFQLRLDVASGVPLYRQIIDQVRGGLASATLGAGDQLPTVRQLAVDLAINPNTVLRAYREIELGGLLETHQGTGTFIRAKRPMPDDGERDRQLTQMVSEFVARAGAANFTVEDLLERLQAIAAGSPQRR
jgi:GntR family transcriptional regulator